MLSYIRAGGADEIMHTLSDAVLKVNNTVVIWDRIVRRKEDATIDVVQKDKYKLRDLSGSFR
jgi:signal peptidase complex subunit 3